KTTQIVFTYTTLFRSKKTKTMIKRSLFFASLAVVLHGCGSGQSQSKEDDESEVLSIEDTDLHVVVDEDQETLSIFRKGEQQALRSEEHTSELQSRENL